MKRFSLRRRSPSSMAVLLIPLLAFLLACGPGQEPTPTTAVPTATPTKAPVATPTTAAPGPVATPTPTSVATPTSTPGEQPRRGGTLRLVQGSLVDHFDPYIGFSPNFTEFLPKAYNNLLADYGGEKVECEVCQEWRLEDNGKTMVFIIKPGIKFQSGKEMTAADVAWSLRMIMGEIDGFVSARIGWLKEYVDKVETPSKYELRIKLIRPSVTVPKLLSTTFAVIIPDTTPRLTFTDKLVGSGPFILKQYISGATATYERNPDYFKPGLPYLDKIQIDVAVDVNTQWAAFMTHRTEYKASFHEPPETFLIPALKLVDEGKLKHFPHPGGGGPAGANLVGSKAPFTDIRVRQAVNLAMDRVELGTAMHGATRYRQQLVAFTAVEFFGTPEDQVWNVLPGWGTGAKKQQEVEQAKQLLKDAGYPNGLDMSQFHSGGAVGGSGNSGGGGVLQAQLKRVGIRTTLDQAKPGADFAARLANRDYVLLWWYFFQALRDPDEVLGQLFITGGSRNPSGYANPEVDRLYVLQSSESDPAKRKQIFLQIQGIILKDVYWAPGPTVDGYWFFYPTLRGVTLGLSPSFASGLQRADRLWLQQ